MAPAAAEAPTQLIGPRAAAGRSPAPRQAGCGRAALCLHAVLAVLDEVVHDARVGQRRGVAERAEIILGDLAQDAAHDLAGPRLGQARCELDVVGRGDRPDLTANEGDELLAQLAI